MLASRGEEEGEEEDSAEVWRVEEERAQEKNKMMRRRRRRSWLQIGCSKSNKLALGKEAGIKLCPLLLLLLIIVAQKVVDSQQVSSRSVDGDIATPSSGQANGRKRQLLSWDLRPPKFAIEPPSMVEYSNSSGAIIACRASSATPTAVMWRPMAESGEGGDLSTDSAEWAAAAEELAPQQQQQRPAAAGGTPARFVRPDGALVITPFKPAQFRRHLHSGTYRCCLTNSFGAVCSRPVRTRAVLDSTLELEVFDELALAGNIGRLKCQLPAHLFGSVEFLGWLKDDRPIAARDELLGRLKWPSQQQQQQQTQYQYQQRHHQQLNQQPQPTIGGQVKYLAVPNGELYIRNVSKLDAGNYKCRARSKLTGSLASSKIGGQLLVEDSPGRQELRWATPSGSGNSLLVYAREHTEAWLCAHAQSAPAPQFLWFRELPGGERRLIGQEAADLDLQPIDSCLLVAQVQLRHAGLYSLESSTAATGSGATTNRIYARLIVGSSAQLSAQIHLIQQPSSNSGLPNQHLQANNGQQIVQFGATVHLNCSISGFPFDSIAWFRNGKLILLVARVGPKEEENSGIKNWNDQWKIVKKVQSNNVKLAQSTVISISQFALKDRGIYQCQVYSQFPFAGNGSNLGQQILANQAGLNEEKRERFSDQLLAELEKKAEQDLWRSSASNWLQLELALSKPVLTSKFQAQNLIKPTITSHLSLQCAATGLPRPKIVWFLDEQPIAGNSRLVGSRESSYNEEADERSSNDEERDDDQFFHQPLDDVIIGPLPAEAGAPSGGQADLLSPIELNEAISRWQREAIADHRFEVSNWLRNAEGKSLGQLPVIVSQLNVSRLTPTESGQYKCLAINPLGSSKHWAQVNVFGGLALRSYQPTNQTLIGGRPASLHCPLIGYPLARVDWFHNERRLPNSHRQRIEPVGQLGFGGHLELSNVDPTADGGLYTCKATMQTAKLQQSFQNETAHTIAASSQASDEQQQQQQQIDNYDDLVGQVRVNVRLAPMIDPQSLPPTVQANEGMRTKLICSVVQGDHPVEIRWLRRAQMGSAEKGAATGAGGHLLAGYELIQNANEDLVTIHNLEDSCLLTFKQISHLDSGDYLCLARNEAGQATRQTRLLVNMAPSWLLEPPAELSVLLGARLQLDCQAHSQPPPSVVWKREQVIGAGNQAAAVARDLQQQQQQSEAAKTRAEPQDFVDLVSNYRHRVYSNGSLIIDQVELSDAGAFMCELSNGIGTGLSRLVRLQINVAPYFKHRQTTQLSQLAGRAELKCVAQGDQPILIGWRREFGETIDLVHDTRNRLINERRLSHQALESTLSIEPLNRNDSGQYICVASNEHGTEEMRIQLIVQEPPEAPKVMRPIRAGSRQATLSFKPPFSGNSPIRKYAIIYRPMESLGLEHNLTSLDWMHPSAQVLVDAPPESSADSNQASPDGQQQLINLNLCCLQPFARYAVRVRAINEIGQSEPSKPLMFLTDEEAIGGPPVDVGVEPTGAHSLKVRWRPPLRQLQNGLIRGYYIGYRAHSGGQSSDQLANKPANQLDQAQQLFAGGESGEQYQYKNVQLEIVTPPGGFNPAHSAANQRQQTLPPSSIGSQFDGLQLDDGWQERASLEFASNYSLHLQQNPQVLTTYLTNLRRKTAYSIIVQAYNKIGAGPRSDHIVVSTLDAAPPMSPSLRILSVGHTSAQLVWTARKLGANQQAQVDSSPGANQRSIGPTLEHNQQLLLAGERFVQLETEIGDEEDDEPQSYFTINFKLVDSKTNHQQQQLAASSSSISPPSSSSMGDEWQQRRVQRRQHSPYVLNNLRCGSHHLAFMTATNSLGQSEPGEQVKFATLGAAPMAPTNSRQFLHVNSTYAILKLSAWHNAGCPIGTFVLKYKLAAQSKWTILEHQVHPTSQTSTLAGSAVFSTRPPAEDSAIGLDEQLQFGNESALSIRDKQQSLNDFIIRNLLAGATYRLIVEANSEAGSTVAEYELETANFSTSTIAITVNGISAADLILQQQQKQQNSGGRRRTSGEPSSIESPGDLDFSFSGGQRGAQSPGQFSQRYPLGVWLLTILFVMASIFMATTTLILGVRSLLRAKPGISNSRESLISTILCCAHRSSSASSSASSTGAHSSHSSSAGTCYQASERPPLSAYCMLATNARPLMMADEISPINGQAGAISAGQLGESGELKSLAGDHHSLASRQMVTSSSLSTIGGRFATLANQQRLANSNSLAAGGAAGFDQAHSAADHIRAHYAATLGKHPLSSFAQQQQAQQPVKYNHNQESPLYGHLRAGGARNETNFRTMSHHHHQPISSIGTSGYETSSSMKQLDSEFQSRQQLQPVYLPSLDVYQRMYGIGAGAGAGTGGGAQSDNLFGRQQSLAHNQPVYGGVQSGAERTEAQNTNQGHFEQHYNNGSGLESGRNLDCQQRSIAGDQQTALPSSYGILFGEEQQLASGEKQMMDQQQQQQQQLEAQEFNHQLHLELLAAAGQHLQHD